MINKYAVKFDLKWNEINIDNFVVNVTMLI